MSADPALAAHGGDLTAVARKYGISADGLVDFSANINPLGPPPSLLRALAAVASDADVLRSYPDPTCASLRDALARRLDVDPNAVVVGNGAAALLDAAVRVRDVRRCLVPVPAFSEYGRALAAARAECVPLRLAAAEDFRLRPERVADAFARGGLDACLIANPHNPSGASIPRADIERIARIARDARAFAIVDEAFVDYVPTESAVRFAASSADTIVVRSLTKFFAVPALRVGYAVCEPELAARLRAILPSWPVTTLACDALVAALDDEAFATRTLRENEAERGRFAGRLRELGLRVFPSVTNFLLIELPLGAPHAADLTRRLAVDHGLVVRDCGSYDSLEPGRYVRVAVRGTSDDDRLVVAIEGNLERRADVDERSVRAPGIR